MSAARARGFTIIEAMVVVAILGILLAVGAPALRDLVRNQRLKTTSLDLYTSLILARSEAIKRNSSTVRMVAAAGGWQAGWKVCFDANADGDCDDASDEVVLTQDAVDSSITLSEQGGASSVTYQRDGRVAAAIEFRLVASANSITMPMRCVAIDIAGRPRTKADSNHTDSDGCN